MNKKRMERLTKARDELEALKEEERAAFDNLPEGLQQSERGQRMEEIGDYLDEAIGAIDQCLDA